MENFRQFYGTQAITFSSDEAQNVTVVFGANGAGKTTLLAAFTWGLYGKFPPAFERPERLVNDLALDKAADGNEVTTKVSVEFDHEDNIYIVERTTTLIKAGDGNHASSAMAKYPYSILTKWKNIHDASQPSRYNSSNLA